MALIRGIKKLRVPYTDHNLLKALVNTNVEVNLRLPNEDLHDLALSYEHACRWVCNNIKPYLSSLKIRAKTANVESRGTSRRGDTGKTEEKDPLVRAEVEGSTDCIQPGSHGR
ncbi:hypothetical protein EJ110_NYTH20508 [Nymphaea thermarum]|nr:hypothetical protein EJ110_NYTH20508 [Nymphaea thermarum]